MAEEEMLRAELVRISKEVYDRGLVSAAGGNISARVPGANLVLIKPSGVRLRDLTPKNLITIDLHGKIVKGKGTPSKDALLHINIYKVRRNVGAVIHAHSPIATAFAVLGIEIPPITVQAKTVLGEIPVITYAPPASAKLADLVNATFRKAKVKAALLQRHGFIAVGQSLLEAFNNAELVEETASVAFFASQLTERTVNP
jgi:L-ribulose-5-phosphate 4-epimerase